MSHEEEDSIKFISDALDSNQYKDRKWVKFKGNLVCRSVAFLLKKKLEPKCKVSEMNAFIEGVNTEFDILILNKDSKPICLVCPNSLSSFDSNVWKRKDVNAIIEVKKNGIYKTNTKETEDYFANLRKEVEDIPLFYITLRESNTQEERTESVTKDMKKVKVYTFGTTSKKDWDSGKSRWEDFKSDIEGESKC